MGTTVKLTLPNIKAYDSESGLGLECRARYEKVVRKGSHFLNKVETD